MNIIFLKKRAKIQKNACNSAIFPHTFRRNSLIFTFITKAVTHTGAQRLPPNKISNLFFISLLGAMYWQKQSSQM